MTFKTEDARDRKCFLCGKTFVPAPEHIFKRSGKWFCKWTCYKKYVDEAAKRKGYHKKEKQDE